MSKEVERYPDPSTFDNVLYENIMSLPNEHKIDLSLVREHIWPDASEFSVPKSKIIRGMQANMFNIQCTTSAGDEKTVIVKRIVPKELPEKPTLEIWQAFVQSVRCEIDFYQELLLQDNEPIRDLFPKIYLSLGTPHSLDLSPMDTSFSIIMEDLSQNYIQKPMMNTEEAKLVMNSLARLHAHYWNRVDQVPRGSFWVLEKRKAFGEVENADKTWNEFVDRFPHLEKLHPDVRKIGACLSSKAEELNDIVGHGANTRIHGDCKGWNFFFAKDVGSSQKPFLFIDMQWTGRGHPLQDVAYALTTTLHEDSLEDMDQLVTYYIDNLGRLMHSSTSTFDISMKQYCNSMKN